MLDECHDIVWCGVAGNGRLRRIEKVSLVKNGTTGHEIPRTLK
jgi:hypothetical protein